MPEDTDWVEGLPTESGLYWLEGDRDLGPSLFRVDLVFDTPKVRTDLSEIQRVMRETSRLTWTRIDLPGHPTKDKAPWVYRHCKVRAPTP